VEAVEVVAAERLVAAVEGCLVAVAEERLVAEVVGCLVAAVGASLVARRPAAPDRLSGPRWAAEPAGALPPFPAGLGGGEADPEAAQAAVVLRPFRRGRVVAIAPKSAGSPASAIDRA
jgi:hypothetical protein